MADPCLVLIDWQKGFGDRNYWGERNNPEAERNAAKLLAYWRKQGWPIVHVRHDSVEPASVLRPGQPGNEIEEFALPSADEPVYSKNVNSAFIGTTLEQDLRARKLTELVFSGVSTDHCVNTTVRMAANLGFEATIVADACYTFDRKLPNGQEFAARIIHDAHLASLAGEFARVVTTDDLTPK